MELTSFLFWKYFKAYNISTSSICKNTTKLLHISTDYWGELYSLLSGLFVHYKLFGNQLPNMKTVIYREKVFQIKDSKFINYIRNTEP